MAISNRLKKLHGHYEDADFKKVLKQLNGRAMLVVTIINNNCPECPKLMTYVQQLESGFINKLPQLVMLHGQSSVKLKDPSKEQEKPHTEINEASKSKKGKKREKDS